MKSFHHRFLKKLIAKTDVTVYLPAYHLAPNHTYADTYPILDTIYDEMLGRFPKVIVMGDSMGGNIAMAFSERTERKPALTILISPWLDAAEDDGRYLEYYKRKPRLSMHELKVCGELWAGDRDVHDPLISPIFGDIGGLNLSVYVGTEELLLLDSERLKERCEKEDIPIRYHLLEGGCHDYPLHPIREADEAIREMAEEIGSV